MNLTLQEITSNIFRGTRKNIKFLYYANGVRMYLTPRWWCKMMAQRCISCYDSLSAEEKAIVDNRVNYYCNPRLPISLPDDAPKLSDNRYRKPRLVRQTVYFFDSMEFTRCFKQSLKWMIFGGDVNQEVPCAGITKSRPIPANGISNNVLLNMDKVRHFIFVNDPFQWEEKACKIIFRGQVLTKENRRRFIQMWEHHPLCDLQDTYTGMSIFTHLKYRYIMALEGNDVASNLKWVMSSNSIAVMPRPTCETWYMEGRLIPNYHYIEIADDYSDLIERIEYYEGHPEEAKAIIRHAHEWVRQFQNKKREELVSLLVMQKYLTLSNKTSNVF